MTISRFRSLRTCAGIGSGFVGVRGQIQSERVVVSGGALLLPWNVVSGTCGYLALARTMQLNAGLDERRWLDGCRV